MARRALLALALLIVPAVALPLSMTQPAIVDAVACPPPPGWEHCDTPTPTKAPTNTPTRVPTSTPTVAPSATATATATTVPPTATAAPSATATATATPSGNQTPVAGQQCPTWLHDSYVTSGPDGKSYPTWHPPVDPQYGCWFGHEHGADPRSVNVNNPQMPAFGYAGDLAGMSEPHEGFKVFVQKAGQPDTDGVVSPADYRLTFHMGTSGVGRYTTRMHSGLYDAVWRDGSGRELHLQGMFDTGSGGGSTCTSPRNGGRDFSEIGCPDTYEIWTGAHFAVQHPADPFQGPGQARAYTTVQVAAFDPITTRDPNNPTTLIYTQSVKGFNKSLDPLSPQAQYRGCDREAYFGPDYFFNAGKPSVYWTDPDGHVDTTAPATGKPGLLKQVVSTVNTFFSGHVEKRRQAFCDPSVRSPN